MLNRTMLATALALLVLAAPFTGPATAQDTTEPADPAVEAGTDTGADTAADATGDAATGFDMGTPVDDGELREGAPYVREEFGDWSLACVNVTDGPDPCNLYQLLKDADDNAVAEIALVPLPAGSDAVAGATIVAPLETLLPEQLTLRIDGGQARRFAFTFCTQRPVSPLLSSGCIARIGLTEADLSAFRRGAVATIRIVPAAAPDQEVVLNLSLIGFTAGYAATAVPAP